LENFGITVWQKIPLIVGVGVENRGYLETKAKRMGHEISERTIISKILAQNTSPD